jgi:cyclophilin family peptidyl-prolyl cis-trans isomerase/HEAT repeat protein
MSCLPRAPIRFASSLSLAALLLVPPLRGQQVDEALVGQLGRLLAATDARRYDVAVLREALRHPDAQVRRQGALAAARIGDPAAVEELTPLLLDTNTAVQAAAAFALGQLHDERAIAPLVALIRSAPPAQQGAPHAEAATALAKIGGERGAAAVRDAIASGPGAAASAATLEAWRLGARAPFAELANAAQSDDAELRWRAVFALGRLRSRQSLQPLVTALQDRDPAVKAIAARGLTKALADSARAEPGGIASRLRSLLNEREPQIRINALRALASFRDSTLATAVAPLAADPDVGVAVQAETTLGALGGGVALATLRARFATQVFAFRRQAAIGLAEASAPVGIAVADSLARDADWRWRSVAAEAFAAARARERLEALTADPDGRVAGQAVQALTALVPEADTSLHSLARRLLTHEDPVVRSGAADLLARGPSVEDLDGLVAAYRRALGDPFNDAALSAVKALGRIAAASGAGRLAVAQRFIAAVPRPGDYLVRRLAAEALPDAREAWGAGEGPIETGRTEADYRDVARRWLVPVLLGQPAPTVTIETDRGVLTVQLLPTEAPVTVGAFLTLVERHFFDGARWHRVVPNFVIQDGDPRGDGWGGPGFVLRDEVNPVRYDAGTVGMALSGPDTGGSQFFITHSRQPHLDGTYPVFGRVTGGAAVLAAVAAGDRIRSIHR